MQKKDSFLIFLAGVVVFIAGHSRDFTGFNCRFAVFAQEMLRNGPTFFPTTYGNPYPDYPAASTFLIYLVSQLFGKVTPFTAVLPTAIVSALILVVIYRIGAIHSRKWGLFAVLFALFTIEFFSFSRSISIDQYTALATVLCFYLVYSATIYHRQKRLWFIPFLFMAGFLFRGPIGLVVPASVVCVYYFYNRDFGNFFYTASISAVLLIIYSLILLATAQYQGGEAFVKQVIEAQVTGRISGAARHWIGYYFTESFAGYAVSYPFAVIVIAVLHKKIFTRENEEYRLLASLVIWIMVVLAGMSIPSARKVRYILPMIPAIALVGSYIFVDSSQNGILFEIKKIFLHFCTWFPLGTTVAILAAWILSKRVEFLSGANYFAAALLMALLGIVSWIMNTKFEDSIKRDFTFLAVGTITFIILMIYIAEPIDNYHNNAGPLAAQIEALQSKQAGEVVFYRIDADGEAIKFMANFDMPLKPQFINNPDYILNFHTPAYFIALKEDFEDLPENITARIKLLDIGKIGRNDCVVFSCF